MNYSKDELSLCIAGLPSNFVPIETVLLAKINRKSKFSMGRNIAPNSFEFLEFTGTYLIYAILGIFLMR